LEKGGANARACASVIVRPLPTSWWLMWLRFSSSKNGHTVPPR